MPNTRQRAAAVATAIGVASAAIGAATAAFGQPAVNPPKQAASTDGEWSSLITPLQLHQRLEQPNLLILDVRSANEYSAGHIPGAINLPGVQWRTPATKNPAVEGPGQRIFRQADGSVDVARYEALLGGAGIKPEHEIVVYGNQAGKADGSVPAAILIKLGHARVAFLDGVGLDRWKQAGYEIATDKKVLPVAKYAAMADPKRLWSYQDVLKNLNNDDVIIIDSRTPAEYAGQDLRGNKRGGHIPGAKLLNNEDLVDKATGTTISREAAKAKVEALIPKGKTVVVYCQSGTRCSHEELILKDLGYENVVLYDASFQEWSNLDNTPVEKSVESPSAPPKSDKAQQPGKAAKPGNP